MEMPANTSWGDENKMEISAQARRSTTTVNIRALHLAAALAVVLAPTSMANSVQGSTYHFSTSQTGTTTITSSAAGTYTDPAGGTFCVGPNADNCINSGLYGSYTFADTTATTATITFHFSGGTYSATGSFSIDLGNFVLPGGGHITGVTYGSGNLTAGSFTSVSWNGTDAVFTGTPNGFYTGGGGDVVFNVTEAPPTTPAPTLSQWGLLLLAGLLAGTAVFKLHRRSERVAS
jgi:hypothetical protein